MELETYLRTGLEKKGLLLMTHVVVGYPSFDDCFRMVEAMAEAGADLMELQIPFSEPIADGPVILRANQAALERGAGVRECLDFAEKAAASFDIPFLLMSYYNILFKYGVDRFVASMADRNLQGGIVPDLPPEEGRDYLAAMKKHALSPIFTFSPATTDVRMKYIGSFARGFIYCIARRGVTGADTAFSDGLDQYLARCRKASTLPLALGFGVKERAHVEYLKGKADIAVVGTQTIRVMEEKGIASAGKFIKNLRN